MVREAEEEMVVLSSMMGGVDGGVFVLAVELGEVLRLELETVSNPGLSDLYSDEKGLRLLHTDKTDTYMYLLHTCVSEESLTCLRETKWSRAKV